MIQRASLWYIGLFAAGFVMALAAAFPQSSPGYMDADYYYAGGLRIASGDFRTEPYLWNYLNNPQALSAPSFAYWMPLVSILAAAGIKIGGQESFWAARTLFFLLAALVPPLTALLSQRLTGQTRFAHLAGVLALFSGFYFPYIATTDAFPLYMVLGVSFLITASGIWQRRGHGVKTYGLAFLLGLLAGLFHLARADGIIWLIGAFLLVLVLFAQSFHSMDGKRPALKFLLLLLAVFAGYLLVMLPWYVRNLGEWGSLFPPGNGRALWITEYEQTMIYPPDPLTAQAWLDAGLALHLSARFTALQTNLQTFLAVQGGIVLLPFILAGLWQLRGCPEVRLGVFLWAVIFAMMSIAFPFAAVNGAFFHSGAALQPLFWAAAPLGIALLMDGYARKRRFTSPVAVTRFMVFLVLGASLLLSGLLYVQRVIGSSSEAQVWNASQDHYTVVEHQLLSLGAQPGEAVLVNNPPGYWLVSQRPALVIPYGDEQVLLEVARRFGARYLVLEVSNPWQLADLYHERVRPAELEYIAAVGTTRLYRIQLQGETSR